MLNRTAVVRLRTYNQNGGYRDHVEVGDWGISGNIYFTTVRGMIKNGGFYRVNKIDPYGHDAYKIIRLTKNRFEYEHVSTGNRYVLTKADADFQLPDCATCPQ